MRRPWVGLRVFEFPQATIESTQFFVVSRSKELQLTRATNLRVTRNMMDRWMFAMKVVHFRKKARTSWSVRCARYVVDLKFNDIVKDLR